MARRLTRRSFLKGTAAVAGAAAASAALCRGPILLAAGTPPSEKVGVAVIGCGSRGLETHVQPALDQRCVAFVDASDKQLGLAMDKAKGKNQTPKTYNDYRKMFDECHKDLDVVFVASCNHHHFLPAMIAMSLGKGALVEKPMAHSVEQCRQMAASSVKYKVATQMGNQGHQDEPFARCVEALQAGVIGKVTEVHSWSDRSNGGTGPRPPSLPVPEGMHWEEWIGPSPYRDYHKDLHPHEWHGWYDFGNCSSGNMACHIADCAVVGLKLQYPTTIEAEAILGGTDERYPQGTRVRMDFAARGDMPALKFYWWDGRRPGGNNKEALGEWATVPQSGQNRPVIVEELEKKYNRKLGGNGTVYIGDKGILSTGTYGGQDLSSLPESILKEAIGTLPKTQPRNRLGEHGHLIQCIKDKTPQATLSNFTVASVLTEIVMLVNLAQKAGVGKKVQWDGPNMKCTNMPELNKLVQLQYRKGWEPPL
jgi:hypothetical protein